MSKITIGVILLFLLVVAPVSYVLYVSSGTRSNPAPAKEDSASEASKGADMSASSPSSELRQIQNTVEHVKRYDAPPSMSIDVRKSYTAVLKTSDGVMRIALDAKATPVTVNNFVFLAREGFYDGTIFHRIIKGFMIQGGDPQGNGRGGPGYAFADEPITKQYIRGTIAMANSGPNTNGSQFFIMHKDYPLPKNYVIFGQIDPGDSESLATLDKIAETPVTDNGAGEMSKPKQNVTVDSMIIQEQ